MDCLCCDNCQQVARLDGLGYCHHVAGWGVLCCDNCQQVAGMDGLCADGCHHVAGVSGFCFDGCEQVDGVEARKGSSPGGTVKSGPQLLSAKQLRSGPVTRSRQVWAHTLSLSVCLSVCLCQSVCLSVCLSLSLALSLLTLI